MQKSVPVHKHSQTCCPVMAFYYPNECFMCKDTTSIKRCSRCNMIAYCGPSHQKEHWSFHKDICKVISAILKERKITHIYENFRGVSSAEWKKVRKETAKEVEKRLGRSLAQYEGHMFHFPRACFVCHDARQGLLNNCPQCPNAHFCQEHPSSSLHDKDCLQIQESHKLDIDYQNKVSTRDLKSLAKSVVDDTPIASSKKRLPTTMKEFMEYVGTPMKLCDVLRTHVADFLSGPLTLFSALQKLKHPALAKLVVHVTGSSGKIDDMKSWEVLFHLIPTLTFLRIISLDCEESETLECSLCEKCVKNKRLSMQTIACSYVGYVETKEFEEPNIVLLTNKNPPEEDEMHQRLWKIFLLTWGRVECPLVLTTVTEQKAKAIIESLRSTFNKVAICYDGINEFAAQRPQRQWETEGVFRENDLMTICRVFRDKEMLTCVCCGLKDKTVDSKTNNCASCVSDLLCVDAALFPKKSSNRSRNFFYVHNCKVCQFRPDLLAGHAPLIPCKRCKMIFYCTDAHQRQHLPEHKDLCKAILTLMVESGSSNLFEKADKCGEDAWKRSKIDLMLKAESKLERKLLQYEKDMFLFPKSCFVCHETNPSVLKTHECGLSLCKVHKNSTDHQATCLTHHLAFYCDMDLLPIRRSPAPITLAELLVYSSRQETVGTVPLKAELERLPESMDDFLDTYIQIKDGKVWLENNPGKYPKLREMMYAEMFTKPLSLLFAMQKYGWIIESMVIHVIGSHDDEKSAAGYWEILLHLVPNLKSLKVFFVGSEVSELNPVMVKVCEGCTKLGKSLEVRGIEKAYDEYYYEKDIFVKPQIVVAFNFHLHEATSSSTSSEIKKTAKSLMLTTLCLGNLGVPFVMTSGTRMKARLTWRNMMLYLGDSLQYDYLELNPFRAMIPERDFETEGYKISNCFITVYGKLHQLPSPVEHLSKLYQLPSPAEHMKNKFGVDVTTFGLT